MIKNIIFDVGKVLIEVRWQEVMRELGMYAIHFQTKCEAEKELEKLGV